MKLGRQINTLTYSEYLHLLENYRKFTDFNHLGLFRSILENGKLEPAQKLEVRDAAIEKFPKFFEFLQIKDPETFLKLETLGQNLTIADERRLWDVIYLNQQRILADKRIRHRNFGVYSKHTCGYDTCNLNGIMIKQGSLLTEREMVSRKKYSVFSKSERYRRERKEQYRTVQNGLADNGL
jgi:hypothetical protein